MTQVHGHNIVACIWDFDKTLIPGYMQKPLFDYYNVDADLFWKEVNSLPDLYGRRGVRESLGKYGIGDMDEYKLCAYI